MEKKFCSKCGKEFEGEGVKCNECALIKENQVEREYSKTDTAESVMKKTNYWWMVMSIVSFITSAIMLYNGYDKYANYYNSETYYSRNVNTYVGGDAYNYIINSNYATGFYVLATMFVILGIGFLIIHYINKNKGE